MQEFALLLIGAVIPPIVLIMYSIGKEIRIRQEQHEILWVEYNLKIKRK